MAYRLTSRNTKSRSITIPAPLKGLNARDNLTDMNSSYAIVMDNYIPSNTKVALRGGYMQHTALPDPVQTLAAYYTGKFNCFLAVAGEKLWNITAKNQPHAVTGATFSDSYCQTAQYKDYLYIVNGLDVPRVYHIDGNGDEHLSAWQFSGQDLQAANIVNVAVSKQRLWFVEKNSLKVWYPTAAGNISGELACFDLATVARFGGSLQAVINWTQDGGQGIDDLTVFLTSEGEVLVYAGTDVANADDWKLRGSYKISRPLGYRCYLPYQGDVVLICEDGYIPLSKALPLEHANASQIAFSDTIRGLVLQRTAANARLRGWQGILYNRGGYGIFNVPVANQFEQHVINISNGAWCRFTEIRAYCWCEFAGRMYFGAADGVFLFDEGFSDNGQPIRGSIEQAYHNLGSEDLKRVQMLNPRTKSSAGFALVIYTNMDLENRAVDYQESISNNGLTKWNKAKWSGPQSLQHTKWSIGLNNVIRSQWIANSATGYKASIVFKTKTGGKSIEWFETGVRYEIGNGVF